MDNTEFVKKNRDIPFIVEDWGMMDYKTAWDKQTEIFAEKTSQKRRAKMNKREKHAILNHLIFVEHPPVFTLGKSGKANHLLLSEPLLKQKNISYYPINRGGDITFHGPGQIVIYPIFDLEQFSTDVSWYLRTLEQIVIDICLLYGVKTERIKGLTGVWVKGEAANTETQSEGLKVSTDDRKICAFGIKLSRWISMHGLAFNANVDLSFFEYIVPCGIIGKKTTSLKAETGRKVDIKSIKKVFFERFCHYFFTKKKKNNELY